MPALSQQQQKLFGLALAVKRGEVPASEVSDEVKDIVDRMSEKDIEDFAGTKHAGLPKKVEAQLREMVREIMRERAISEIEQSVNEVVSRTAMEIGALTGLNKNAVQDFVDKHELDIEKLYKGVKSMNLAGRMNLVTAIAGKPGNSLQKLTIKLNKKNESVNEVVKPSQVRSVISKVKKDLMKKWQQKGGYENFGDKEGDMLRKKFNFNPYGSSEEREIAKMIQGFENWAMNYDGNMREDLNEGFSTEEKRIVLMAVKKLAKYRNVPLDYAINDLLGAGQELERDIKKGKIK